MWPRTDAIIRLGATSNLIIIQKQMKRKLPLAITTALALPALAAVLPFSETFESGLGEFSVEDANNDGITVKTAGYSGVNYSNCIQYPGSAESSADDWLFTPAFNLKKGYTYTLTYQYKVSSSNTIHKVEWKAGAKASSDEMTIGIASEVDSVNGKVVPVVYYYEGKPGGDAGIIGADGQVHHENNNLKESAFLSSDAKTGTARGIRELIQNRNKAVLEKISELKKKYEDGGFGSLETKEGREKAQEAYNKAASEVRRDSTLSKPVIIIKSTPNATYESLINVLDEMQINQIAKYQIDNMTQIDSVMVLDYRGMLNK